MLKYLFECINCGAICHFPLDSDQLLKAKTRNIEQKLREEKIPLCFESERSIILRHNWKKLRAQYRELQIGPSRFGSVRFHSGWARFLPLRFFLLKTKLATIFLQEDRFVPQRSAKKCIEIYTVLAHNLLFISKFCNSFAKSVNFRCRGVVHENSNWTLAYKNYKKKT